jgi:DNA-binding beta-propeller fold protein YncE
LGTGYTQPEDIAVTADGKTAYITERSGDLVRVSLSSANRSSATVVTSGLNSPQQMALDEAHSNAYVVEFASPGRLLRVNLVTGVKTALVSSLQNAIGVLLSADLSSAYVTQQTSTSKGTLTRYDLASSSGTLLYTSATAPLFFLTWADPSESALLVTERDPANQVWRVDLTTSPVTVASLVTGVPAQPSSVVITSPTNLLICSDSEISDLDLTGGAFSPSGPVFLGIGLVPITSIKNSSPINPLTDGFATTAPGYYLQVTDSPFGSSLTLMINHAGVYAAPLNARYYQLLVDGSQPLQSFDDYLWNGTTFVLQTTSPLPGGFYPVRSPGQLWYNPTLGYILDTSELSNGIQESHYRVTNHHPKPLGADRQRLAHRRHRAGSPQWHARGCLRHGDVRSRCVYFRHHCRRPGTASAELELDRPVGRQQVEGRGLRQLQQPPSRSAVGGHYQYRRSSCGRTAPFGGALGCGCNG